MLLSLLISRIKRQQRQKEISELKAQQEWLEQRLTEADELITNWYKRRLEADKNQIPFDEPPPLPSTTIRPDSTLSLNWQYQDAQGEYYQLNSPNLNTSYLSNLEGVYIIWYKDPNESPVTVHVGQTNQIGQRLNHHRRSLNKKYRGVILQVAWAQVSQPNLRSFIERYILDVLKPSGRRRAPDHITTTVNLPPPWGNNTTMNVRNKPPITYLLDNIPPHDVYVEPDRRYRPREISWKEFSDILVIGNPIIISYLNEETKKYLRDYLPSRIPETEPDPISIDPHVAEHILVAQRQDDGSYKYFSLE